MPDVYARGLECIRQIQSVSSPALDLAARAVTSLGNETFFLVLLPFLYWCLDSRLGLRVGVLFFVSGFLNFLLKAAFAQPRPFDLVPGINLIEESGYGLPSGHAQGAVVLWGLLARAGNRRWLWLPAALLMAVIGFSRIYLGVHFPTDVAGGWLAGGLLLAGALGAQTLLARCRSAGRRPALTWWAWLFVVSLVALLSLLALADRDTVSATAAFWGFAVGYVLRRRFWADTDGGTVPQRLLRLPVGLVVLLALYLGLKAAFPAEGQALYLPFRFLRYALIGLWGALGAPVLFRTLRLLPATR